MVNVFLVKKSTNKNILQNRLVIKINSKNNLNFRGPFLKKVIFYFTFRVGKQRMKDKHKTTIGMEKKEISS